MGNECPAPDALLRSGTYSVEEAAHAVSTYGTDYLLVKTADLPAARAVLADAGYELV